MLAIVAIAGVSLGAADSPDFSLMRQTLNLVRDLSHRFSGQVCQFLPGGLLLQFGEVLQAVACAIEIQRDLLEITTCHPDGEKDLPQIGIHYGVADLTANPVQGDAVEVALGLQGEASPGHIYLSQMVYDSVKSHLTITATHVGMLALGSPPMTVPAFALVPGTRTRQPAMPDEQPAVTLAETEAIAPSRLINNRYRMERLLGRGGFGQTYLAADTHRFDDPCVLKEFLPMVQGEHLVQKSRQLFEREAKVLYQIRHAQIPQFLAWFTDQDRIFIVQEYIAGKTYATLLQDRQQQGQSFSEAEIIQWLEHLLSVLDYVHGLSLVHRDISPENIMLSDQLAKPVLIDFGIVKQKVTQMWATTCPHFPDSGPASMVGKFGYSPPEQLRLGRCYPCSDLYALAATAVVLLTGRKPLAMLDQSSMGWYWRPYAAVSDRLAAILDRMLAEKPRDRYQTVSEVLAAMAHLTTSAPTQVAQGGGGQPLPGLTQPAAPPVNDAAEPPLPPATHALSAQFWQQCQQELAQAIGPMASCLIDDLLDEHPNPQPQQVVAWLAAQIPHPQLAAAFRQRMTAAATATPVASRPSVELDRLPAMPSPSPAVVPAPVAPSAAFIAQCRQVLARGIGPMANLIVDEILAGSPHLTPRQLVEAIAAEVPLPQQAELRQQLLALLE